MLVSVVIPVYNRFWEVKDAVESLMRQKRAPAFEIIVVDDASDEPIQRSLEPYAPIIKLIALKENSGVSKARNVGADAAKGRFLAFLDSDDLFLPYKLAHQVDIMQSGAFKASHTDEYWFKGDRFINQARKHARYGGEIFSKVLDKCRISPSSFMIEKTFFSSLGGFNESLRTLEDYEFFIRAADRTPIEYIEEKLIIKRALTQNSLSSQIVHIESGRLDILQNILLTVKLKPEHRRAAEIEVERKLKIVGKRRS
ncbi:MAG: glycosyltransferase family 2 protein [Deferribacteraceae bacterium]|jgi:glycosyltransferase involved in cell wall biosynthesis|nr:glycosyltransferase family 2 protein [Deferribacteraceae bacterium]